MMVSLVIALSIYVLTTVGGLTVLKMGTSDRPPIAYRQKRLVFNFNHVALLGIALYGISFLAYVYLLSQYSLGYIIPLAAALVYIALFISSRIIFNETFSRRKITGIFLIIFGVLLLSIHGV